MPEPAESPFCSTCEHNQALVQQLIAEYLPDDDDPEYDKYAAAYDGYRAELEDRYPQVCKKCEQRVNDQIRQAGYAAKADHLRRIMERSEQKRRAVQTTRQSLTLKVISLAKWTYIVSFFVQVLWHAFGTMMAPDERVWEEGDVPTPLVSTWDACLRQAAQEHSVDDWCVMSPDVTKIVFYALIADLLTIWWNPRLKDKTNSITGRMRGLKTLWAVRGAVLVLRGLSLYYWPRDSITPASLAPFFWMHTVMLAIMGLSALLTWKTVRITYQVPTSFRGGSPSSVPASAEKPPQSSYKPAHPQAGMFDTMAHQFAAGINDEFESAAYPPSPTLTHTSYTTHATEATTPYTRKTTRVDDDAMEWTPTQRRFAPQQPTVHPSPWARREPSPPPQKPTHPHSLFAEPDANPFHRKVPAAPKPPAQVKANPWKPGVWNPPPKETVPNFFEQDRKARGGVGETKGLDGFGVPKNVKRDAELFASPKFKYDNYTTPKETGLESVFEQTFNGFFSK